MRSLLSFKSALLLPVITPFVYLALVFTLTIPYVQRHIIYAHKLYPGFSYSPADIEVHGFPRGQVTPFNFSSPDGEVLSAWHVLPLNTYAANRKDLDDARTETPRSGLDLLRSDPDARVLIFFHGVAGHVSAGWRTYAYRYLTDLPNVHVLALDYRGYGSSTGDPTEPGLIVDGIAFLDHVLNHLNIPASRVVVMGHSLGTAVASAVALHFAKPSSHLLPDFPARITQARLLYNTDPIVFAGIILVAPFASFPDMMMDYRIKGLIPLLRPLRSLPNVKDLLSRHIPDSWQSAKRLGAYYQHLTGQATHRGRGHLTLIHAANDIEMSAEQTAIIVKQVTGQHLDIARNVGVVTTIKKKNAPDVSVEIISHGAHSRIVTFANVVLAVKDMFDRQA